MNRQKKQTLLEIKNLKTCFATEEGIIRGCDGINLEILEGETVALVGESGAGKSLTSLSIMQLIAVPPGYYEAGEILFKGEDLLKYTPAQMQKIRGNEIAMIFQEPMTSLNPVHKVGKQIAEPLRIHRKLSPKEAQKKAVDLLRMVGIPSPEDRFHEYPVQLSGGMRQRVMIAMALACGPSLLIADEPTSALDVTIQEQLMRLLKKLQQEQEMAVLFITHDMGVVAELADTAAVMYAGRIVEYGSVEQIFHGSKHPYVEGLKNCIPRLDKEQEELPVIEGMMSNLLHLPKGCRFAPRCPRAMDICHKQEPVETLVDHGHYVRCWLYGSNDDA